MPGPIVTLAKWPAMRSTISSCTRSWTSTREPAEQVCPAFWRIARRRDLRRPVDRRIVEHHVRRLAAELEHDRRDALGGRGGDEAADPGRADEAEVVDAGVGGERRAGLGAESGHDVEDPGWEAGSRRQLGDAHGLRGVSSAGFSTAQLPVAMAGATPRASSCIG